MGMDAWIMAKTSKLEGKSATGVCSGLFGIIPTAVADAAELGYIRKGYDQDQVIGMCAHGVSDDGNLYLSKESCEKILQETQRILKEHKFDVEDGHDLTEDDPKFYPDYTWQSKQKHQIVVEAMKKALEILREDPDAKIYYHTWY